MMATLPRPLRQIAALLLLALALTLAFVLIAAPLVQTLRALQSSVQEKRETLGRLSDTQSAEDEAQSLALSLSREDTGNLYVAGDSDAMRFASLQTALTAIATAQGVRLRATRALKLPDANGVPLVAVAASFEATMAQLQEMLLAIDRHAPMLIAGDIRIVPAAAAMPDAAGTGETLDVEMDVRAPIAKKEG